jgi:hypothetical protein
MGKAYWRKKKGIEGNATVVKFEKRPLTRPAGELSHKGRELLTL